MCMYVYLSVSSVCSKEAEGEGVGTSASREEIYEILISLDNLGPNNFGRV